MSRFRFAFRPRLLDALRHYRRGSFLRDLSAGLTVGVVALPLAMAFAIASGAKPEAGIITAIIAGFLVSALGGSRVQIGGPAGAFIVIIYGIIEQYGFANLLIATVFAGILLCTMGALKLGAVIRYIPTPIVIGFTNGIAVLIALAQLKDFLGLRIDRMPADFFSQTEVLFTHLHTINVTALLLGMASLVLITSWSRLSQHAANHPNQLGVLRRAVAVLGAIPGTIIVLAGATVLVSMFSLPVETIGTRFGGIPQKLPSFALPEFSWNLVQHLFPPALTIALLGAIESLLCARVADNITGDRHDPNQELMAQGIANVVTPFFGGLPATGTIARTVTNIRSGAVSPIAGIIHAFALLAIVLVAAPLAKNVPLAALAAILLFVAFNMGEWHEFARLRQFSTSYRILLLTAFLLTVVIDLTVAVEVGLVLACVFFIFKIASLTRIEPMTADRLPVAPAPGVVVYSIFGTLFFGAADRLEHLLDPETVPAKALVLDVHQLIKLDATGLDAMQSLYKGLHKIGCQLILCGASHQPLEEIARSGFLQKLGEQNFVASLPAAMARANALAAVSAPSRTGT